MTQNPFWIEATASGLRAYFMPEDGGRRLHHEADVGNLSEDSPRRFSAAPRLATRVGLSSEALRHTRVKIQLTALGAAARSTDVEQLARETRRLPAYFVEADMATRSLEAA
jgi:hypothetical protein